jgi:CRISPR/Cas system Type II protein with McrA/HNH and RuvC-like nuclease domain
MSWTFAKVFERDHHRCVFCGRDLLVDFESWMLSQEDHLVPSSKLGLDELENRVIACYVCNKLKAAYVPDFPLTETNRTKYINAIRDHIMSRRSYHMSEFATWTHAEPGDSAEPPTP